LDYQGPFRERDAGGAALARARVVRE